MRGIEQVGIVILRLEFRTSRFEIFLKHRIDVAIPNDVDQPVSVPRSTFDSNTDPSGIVRACGRSPA
jgi:hypothetical protein